MSEQQQDIATVETSSPPNGRRRVIMVAGIAAVVAALGVGAYVLLGAGDDQTGAANAARAAIRTSASASPQSTPSLLTTAPPLAIEPLRQDPFRPLYSPKPAPSPSSIAAPSTPPPVVVTTPPVTTPPVVAPPPVIAPSPTPTVKQDSVLLLSTSAKAPATVTVTVDGVVLTGKAGDILGKIVKIVSIRAAEGGATFQMGEATFDLHIGQSYTN